ncbi:hypothetical protein ACTFIZ_000654 [Dictyostelium cf. discoideum]
MNKVKKTEIVSDWSQLEVKKATALKSLLVRYTQNHIEECEKLEKDIGSDQALSTTIAGMKNIELLKVSSNPTAQKTCKACNTLVKLVNYSGKLMHEYNISSDLIIKTKMDVYNIKSIK